MLWIRLFGTFEMLGTVSDAFQKRPRGLGFLCDKCGLLGKKTEKYNVHEDGSIDSESNIRDAIDYVEEL